VAERRAGVVRAQDAAVLFDGPLGAFLLAGGDATAGAGSVVVHPIAPRTLGAPVHTHRREDEWSYVLEGELGVELAGEALVARAGDLVLKPRDVPHAFWNPGDVPARVLEIITPSGFEHFFAGVGRLAPGGGPPDLEAFARLCVEHGLEMDLASAVGWSPSTCSWVPDLTGRPAPPGTCRRPRRPVVPSGRRRGRCSPAGSSGR
jgi:mannose-6-phosphate isomerase-like protein (cupin superfamily)